MAELEFCMESLGNDGDDNTLGCFYVVNEVGILVGATLIRSYDCFRRQGWMFLSNLSWSLDTAGLEPALLETDFLRRQGLSMSLDGSLLTTWTAGLR